MKICLVGHHDPRPDEGVRKITYHLGWELEKRHPLMRASITELGCWRAIRSFQPDIIHFVLSPTIQGLIAAKLLSLAYRPAATVVSAPHPHLRSMGRLASWFRPDLLLVQAEDSERRFGSLGFKTQFLPNGVDTSRFVPVDPSTRERLRNKYEVDTGKFVILHVGALNRGRNLESMQSLQDDDVQVLVVGRASERGDPSLAGEMRGIGCLVWTEYLSNLEEVYALSDCYVFPTTSRRYCVEMPLSVMEAMSCNLPVVTTRFGALPRAFEAGGGLIFAEGEEDLAAGVDRVKAGLRPNTRGKVLPLDWTSVVHHLERVYAALVPARNSREGQLRNE